MKSRLPLGKAPVRKTLDQKTAQQLIPEADDEFSRYIRLRDCKYTGTEWVGKCISCSRTGTVAWIDEKDKLRFIKGWDAGHFVSRGVFKLRWDEENVNLQCNYHCNKMLSGNIEKQKPEIDMKYGTGTWKRLQEEAQAEDSHKRPTKQELLEMIQDYKALVKYTFENR